MLDGLGCSTLRRRPLHPSFINPKETHMSTTSALRRSAPSRLVAVVSGTTVAALSTALVLAVPAAAAPEPCSAVQPCRLSVGLPASFSPNQIHLTPDGDTVVFDHTAAGGTVRALYSVPVRRGQDPVRLDPPNAPPNEADAVITPDGSRVLYRSERGLNDALFSVPLQGPASATVRLSPGVPAGGSAVQVSPNGRLVVHLSATRRIRLTPAAGPESATVVLTRTPVDSFDISADGRSVVYIAAGEGGAKELFRVPLTLNPDPDQVPTRLNGPLVAGGGVRSFRLPDGPGPVVYSADEERVNIRELYSVSFTGARRTKLNVPLPPGWRVPLPNVDLTDFHSGYAISPDGQRVTYVIGSSAVFTLYQLFSVPSAGPASASRRLDVTTPDTIPPGFHPTADSSRVVYQVPGDHGGPGRTFSVPIDGPAADRIAVSSFGEDGTFVQVSPGGPDGPRVVSRARIFNQDVVLSGPVDEPIFGPGLVRLNGTERLTGGVRFDPTGERVVYVADADGPGPELDVFSSSLTTSGSRYNLTSTLTADRIAQLHATDQHAVYAANVSDDGYQLYSSPLVPGP